MGGWEKKNMGTPGLSAVLPCSLQVVGRVLKTEQNLALLLVSYNFFVLGEISA